MVTGSWGIRPLWLAEPQQRRRVRVRPRDGRCRCRGRADRWRWRRRPPQCVCERQLRRARPAPVPGRPGAAILFGSARLGTDCLGVERADRWHSRRRRHRHPEPGQCDGRRHRPRVPRRWRTSASRRGGGSGLLNTDYRSLATLNANGQKGEGIAGTPRYVRNGVAAPTNTGVEGYVNGSSARGLPETREEAVPTVDPRLPHRAATMRTPEVVAARTAARVASVGTLGTRTSRGRRMWSR